MKLRTLGLFGVAALLSASVAQASFITVGIQIQDPATSNWVSSLDVVAGQTYNYQVFETVGLGTGAGKTVTTVSATDGLKNMKFDIKETGTGNLVDLTTTGTLASVWANAASSTKNGVGSATAITGIIPTYTTGLANSNSVFYTGTFTIAAGAVAGSSSTLKGAWASGYTGGGTVNGGSTFAMTSTSELGDSSTLAKTPAINFQALTLSIAPPPVTASVSMTATAAGENVADFDNLWKASGAGNAFVDVINIAPGMYASEVDDLSGAGAFTSGSVAINSVVTGDGPAIVMLWLNGTSNDISALVSTLDAAGAQHGYDIALTGVGSGDALYRDIHKLLDNSSWYNNLQTGGAFSALVKFNNPSSTNFFNFDFTGSNVQLNRVAVVPEPASLGLLALGAMGLISRRRKA